VGVAAAGLLAGCAGYQLGSTLPPDIRTVHVMPFANQSGEPLLENETMRAAVAEFQKDGTLRVVDSTAADLLVEVTLTECKLEPVRYNKDSARTAQEYRLWIRGEIRVKRQPAGTVMFSGRVEGESTFDFAGDLASAKTRAIPVASRDLAHDIVENVVEYW
jgi:hypothetical protein